MSSSCFIRSVLVGHSVSFGGDVWPLSGAFVSIEISIFASIPEAFRGPVPLAPGFRLAAL
jgi:hypothetical protein